MCTVTETAKARRRQGMTDRLVLLLPIGCLAFGSIIFVELQLTGTHGTARFSRAGRLIRLSRDAFKLPVSRNRPEMPDAVFTGH
jgi:hypothetical protein